MWRDGSRPKLLTADRRPGVQTVDAATTLEQTKEIRRRFERGLSAVQLEDQNDEDRAMDDLSMRDAVQYDPNRPIRALFRVRGTVLLQMLTLCQTMNHLKFINSIVNLHGIKSKIWESQ